MRRLVIIVAVVLGGSALAGADEWKPFSSADGRYQASFPGAPKQLSQKMDDGSQANIAKLDTATASYIVSYRDVPRARLDRQKPEDLLKAQSRQAVDKVKGKVLSEKKIVADGYPGLELEIEAPGNLELTEHVFLVKARLYQVLVVTPKGKGTPADTKKFLDSFKFQA